MRKGVLPIAAVVVPLFACAVRTIEHVHTVDFVASVEHSPTVRWIATLAGASPVLAFAIIVVVGIALFAARRWHAVRSQQKVVGSREPRTRKVIEEREEIRRTRITKTYVDE
jgi:hypothetical protein